MRVFIRKKGAALMPKIGHQSDGSGDLAYPIDQMRLTADAMAKQTQNIVTETTQSWRTLTGDAHKITVSSTQDALHSYLFFIEQGLGQLLDYRASLGQHLGEATTAMSKQDQQSASQLKPSK